MYSKLVKLSDEERKARKREYSQRPEVKAKNKEYQKNIQSGSSES